MNAFPLPPSVHGVHWTWWVFVLIIVGLLAVNGWWRWRIRQQAVNQRPVLLPSFERECRIVRAYIQGNPAASIVDASGALHRLHLKLASMSMPDHHCFRGRKLQLAPSLLRVALGISWGLSSGDLAQLLGISKSHVYRQRKELRDLLRIHESESLDAAVVELFGEAPVKIESK